MKEKKPIYKRVWFIALVVIVVVGVIGSSGSGDDSKSAKKGGSSSSKEETSYHIGDVVAVGDVEYTINSISTTKSVGSEYLKSDAKGTYLVVNVTVKNNGSEELMVDSTFFNLINGDKEFGSDSTAGMYANEDASFFLEYVNPDLSLTGNVVFDVSDETINAEDLQIKVQTGSFGTETELIYLNK